MDIESVAEVFLERISPVFLELPRNDHPPSVLHVFVVETSKREEYTVYAMAIARMSGLHIELSFDIDPPPSEVARLARRVVHLALLHIPHLVVINGETFIPPFLSRNQKDAALTGEAVLYLIHPLLEPEDMRNAIMTAAIHTYIEHKNGPWLGYEVGSLTSDQQRTLGMLTLPLLHGPPSWRSVASSPRRRVTPPPRHVTPPVSVPPSQADAPAPIPTPAPSRVHADVDDGAGTLIADVPSHPRRTVAPAPTPAPAPTHQPRVRTDIVDPDGAMFNNAPPQSPRQLPLPPPSPRRLLPPPPPPITAPETAADGDEPHIKQEVVSPPSVVVAVEPAEAPAPASQQQQQQQESVIEEEEEEEEDVSDDIIASSYVPLSNRYGTSVVLPDYETRRALRRRLNAKHANNANIMRYLGTLDYLDAVESARALFL